METITNIRRSRALQSIRLGNEPVATTWSKPEASTGNFITTIGRQKCYEASGPAHTAFLAISQDIKRFLDTNTEPTPHWVTWSIYMIGRQPETAVPTIIFCCEDEPYRRKIRDAVRDDGLLAKYPAGIALKHLPRAPDYKRLIQLASGIATGFETVNMPDSQQCQFLGVYSTTPRPQPGDPLFIETGSDLGPRKATAGGMIWHLGLDYLMTAAHAFENQLVESSSADEDLHFSDSDGDVDLLSQASRSSEDLKDFSSAQSTDSIPASTEEYKEETSTASPTLIIPQPKKQVSESHDSHDPVHIPEDAVLIGFLVFSSIKQSDIGLDYALIRLVVNQKPGHYGPIEFPKYTKEEDFEQFDDASTDADIDTHTSRLSQSGLQLYTMSAGVVNASLSLAPVFLRLPNAQKYQQVYTIRLRKPLAIGDCGAWVFHHRKNTTNVLGHVIAGSPEARSAFIVPISRIFKDVEKMLPTIEACIESSYGIPKSYVSHTVVTSSPGQNDEQSSIVLLKEEAAPKPRQPDLHKSMGIAKWLEAQRKVRHGTAGENLVYQRQLKHVDANDKPVEDDADGR